MAEETKQASITVELDPKSFQGRILVFVKESGGAGIEDATVSLSGPVDMTKQTDRNNVAEFDNVPIGEYSVDVSHPLYQKSATYTISESAFEAV